MLSHLGCSQDGREGLSDTVSGPAGGPTVAIEVGCRNGIPILQANGGEGGYWTATPVGERRPPKSDRDFDEHLIIMIEIMVAVAARKPSDPSGGGLPQGQCSPSSGCVTVRVRELRVPHLPRAIPTAAC